MPLETPLDIAHARMLADQNDDAARLGFYSALADSELFILLEREAEGEKISPDILELDDDKYTLVFDTEERFADFSKTITPYAALPGRVIAGMLAGQGIGMGLNLGVASSSILIPAEAMEWLTQTLAEKPVLERSFEGGELEPLADGAKALLPGLQDKLKFAGGHIKAVYLTSLARAADHRSLLLACFEVTENQHVAIVQAAQEALAFSGLANYQLEVIFLAENGKIAQEIAGLGTAVPLPEPQPKPKPIEVKAPGSDPDKPPILR